MGVKDSKPSLISYEDAAKRVTEAELQRIKDAFKRCSGAGCTTLSKTAFIQDVLCDGVPPAIADWLFTACGGTAKGIAFKELLCGLVLLTKGTIDEKIKFIWTLYCNDSGTHIIKLDFLRAAQIESTYQSNIITSNNVNLNIVQQQNKTLFGQSDRVGFEQFKSWILIYKNATVLSKWLLIDTCVNLSSELETPTFYQSLAGVTHLEEQDISDLEKVFWLLKGSSINGQLDLESLGPLITPPIPQNALAGVFLAFDENRDGHIDFKELCCGVSAACRGPSVERTKFCFKVFDTDRDGILNLIEIHQMINILIFVAKECSNSHLFKHITFNQVLSQLYNRVNNNNKNNQDNSSSEEDLTPTTEIIDINIPDFKLTQEDFLMWSIESTINLVQPFLDLLFEVCHIVLGLRPQGRHLENDIVKGWLSREVRRGYKVGQFWYLISSEWWQNWLQYTQTPSQVPCSYCKTSTNYLNQRNIIGISGVNVDEAIICDESFTSNSTESMGDLLVSASVNNTNGHTAFDSSSLGSGSSGISCSGRQLLYSGNGRPGPIDNSNLIAATPFKNVQTLTGEGGRLKRDLPLAQHRDFELVPDSLWKALSQWYTGPLPLPRQVIQPPNSPDVDLELYPLNLRILRHQAPVATPQASTAWSISGGYGALTTGSYTTVSSVTSAVLQPPKKYLAYTAAFSRLATVKQVGEFLCQRLKLRVEDIRIWHIMSSSNSSTMNEFPCLLEEEHMILQDLMINDNDEILLEIRNKDLTWPEELGSLSALSQSNMGQNQLERRSTIASIQSVHPPGATGLHNLGNTCFLNAALQVLFNTQPLTQYFKQNMHLYELNNANKLGTKGQLATRYAELLKEIWTASTRSVAPLKLRFCVTKYAPQFAGGGQHDSQELLDWLLDSLHEDLNRVMEKPYIELKDSDGRADNVVASEAWQYHKSRNQSIIIDLFYGQLKSKVSCLGCGRDSVRFDPFSLLSLPLPVENFTYCEILVTLLDGSVPIKYGVRLNSDSKYWDLKKQLSTLCSLSPDQMLICELSVSQIRCILSNEHKIKSSTATELYVYELPKMGMFQRSRASSELSSNIEKGLKDIQRNQVILIMSPAEHNHMTTTSTISSSSTTNSDDTSGAGLTPLTVNKPRNDNSAKIIAESNQKTSKHSAEISTSPESTFIDNKNNRKTISTTNLLNNDCQSYCSSLEEQNMQKQNFNNSNECINDITNDSITNINSNDDADNNKTSDNDIPLNNNSNNSILSAINTTQLNNENYNKKCGYLIAVHRKLSPQDTYFLSHHKSRPGLFGVPLLIPCYDGVTNKELYCSVWMQVSRLLSPLPPTPPDQANHATDCDDSLGYDFPFTLRAVVDGGRNCALCPWTRFCRGCEIACNDEPLLQGLHLTEPPQSNISTPNLSSREQTPSFPRKSYTNSISSDSHFSPKAININHVMNTTSINIAIDWDPTALHLRYQSSRERLCTEHASVAICRKQQTEPVDLDHCLRAFTSEEKLEQWYHCAHCKGKKPATKKLQIWKLPPILIVHLKRFNYVNNKWVKSQKVVNFPFSDFDPTPYLASVPQETILRHKELLEYQNQYEEKEKNLRNYDCDDEIIEFDRENSIINKNNNNNNNVNNNNNNSCDVIHENDDDNDTAPECSNEYCSEINQHKKFITNQKRMNNMNMNNNNSSNRKIDSKRKRLVSTSLTRTPVIDGEFIDFHDHQLKDGDDPFNLKYQLYAVVSHSGMLNGGHYISYAANPNGSWYCYNDSSCREIPQRPNIDPSSAYLLFYERQGLNYSPYLPKVDGKQIPNGNLNIDTDDNENDLRKMCVLT